MDGIYVIRTRETAEQLSAADTVRGYKSLADVERAFRSLKSLDLLIRPIHHRTEERVPAHIFLCLLAYYLEWHLRRVWAPLLFEDEELPHERSRRDQSCLPAARKLSKLRNSRTRRQTDCPYTVLPATGNRLSSSYALACSGVGGGTSWKIGPELSYFKP